MRHFLLSIFLLSLTLAVPASLRADHNVPATYTVGNVDGVSAGDMAELNFQEASVLIHSGDTDMLVPYTKIQNAELGARLTPSHKGLHVRKEPARRTLTIEFSESAKPDSPQKVADKKDQTPKTMSFEMDGSEAEDALVTINERSGKNRKTNGDSWWGDSAWKTNRNGQSVKPDSIGKLEN